MFSTSPVVKSTSPPPTPTNCGGFIVTEEDYAPHMEKPSGSDYGNISWELHTDASAPNTFASPHFSTSSLTAYPSAGSHTNNVNQFHRDDSPENNHFGGFTVRTGADMRENQMPTPNMWSDAPPSMPLAAHPHAPPAPRSEYARRERQENLDGGNYGSGGGGAVGFVRQGPYASANAWRHGHGGVVDHGSPYAYQGPGADYQRNKRLHQDFKALTKEERQTLVEKQAAVTNLLERTVHLRFLPTCMRQSELAEICTECGEYLRVRICGNSTSNQNWIYGFIEFASKDAADRMLEKSGMELFNGPGRPPLRLKCNAAKQPIVDRVFHDADTESNAPCIFGLGNFASRTLKDALDSYFHLKAKEQQQMEQDQPGQPPVMPHPAAAAATATSKATLSPYFGSHSSSQGGTSPQLNSVGTSITSAKLSPQAKAFVPGQGFIAAASGAATTASQPPPVHVDGFTGRITPMTMPAAATRDSADSTSSTDEGSATPVRDARQASSVLTDFLATKSGGARTPISFTPTSRDAQGLLFPPPAYGLSQDGGSLGSSPMMGFSTCAAPRANLPSVFTADASTALSAAKLTNGPVPLFPTMPVQNPVPLSTTTTAAAAAAALAGLHMPQSDAEVVLQRAAGVAVNGLRRAETFLRTNDGFFDAVGTLRTLLDLLQRHAALTGGPANTTSRDFTAELPQKTTQLRLFANVVLALLYLGRRAFSDALPFIQAAVTICKEIGHEPLTRPASLGGKDVWSVTGTRSGPPSSTNSVSTTSDCAVGAEQVHDTERQGGPTMGAFFASQQAQDMIYGDMEAYLSGTDRDIRQATEQLARVDGDTRTSAAVDAAAVTLYARDVRFHAYVWNALIALGMALEEVRPDIAHSVFALASSQARDVLHMASPTLDTCLQEPAAHIAGEAGSYPRLCALLYPEAMARSCDITTFPRLFFQKSRELPLESFLESGTEEFWCALPPSHCVQCFPA